MHPDNEDAYAVHVWMCHACAAKERKRAAMSDEALVGAYLTADLQPDEDDDD